MDLADSNGLALGDDEAEEALKQMQMLVSDVDLLPPLYRSRDDGELKLRTGKPARMLRPRDFCLMVLEHGHWLGVTALRDKDNDVWHISIQGIARMDQQDEHEWQATLNQLTGIPPAKMRLREASAQPRIPGACGFAALASIANQCQHSWDWNPLDATGLHSRSGVGCEDFQSPQESSEVPESSWRASLLQQLRTPSSGCVSENITPPRGPTEGFFGEGRTGDRVAYRDRILGDYFLVGKRGRGKWRERRRTGLGSRICCTPGPLQPAVLERVVPM